MADIGDSRGRKRVSPALLAAAGLALAAPGAVLAVGAPETAAPVRDLAVIPFTPANADPELARRVAEVIGAEGLRFTPAGNIGRKDRTVTVAVRVDEETARALAIGGAMDTGGAGEGRLTALDSPLAPTRYNLGIARGYQSFAQPSRPALPISAGLRDVKMPDLADFRTDEDGKPARFQPRIAFEQDERAGRAPRTLEGLADQSVDVGGSYRLGRNLNVTAGVRLSQDRDRLAPLTDGEADSQAVYVGTQIRF